MILEDHSVGTGIGFNGGVPLALGVGLTFRGSSVGVALGDHVGAGVQVGVGLPVGVIVGMWYIFQNCSIGIIGAGDAGGVPGGFAGSIGCGV